MGVDMGVEDPAAGPRLSRRNGNMTSMVLGLGSVTLPFVYTTTQQAAYQHVM